jgi:hypothetical protein
MLVPYLNLPGEDRVRILAEELRRGSETWSRMSTKIDGRDAVVLANRKWGIVALGGRLLALEQYPLTALHSVSTQESTAEE